MNTHSNFQRTKKIFTKGAEEEMGVLLNQIFETLTSKYNARQLLKAIPDNLATKKKLTVNCMAYSK